MPVKKTTARTRTRGYVPYGTLENYTDGRSNGCTSWSPSDAEQIIPLVKDKPTKLFIYPEAADIEAVAQAVRGAGRCRAPHYIGTCLA